MSDRRLEPREGVQAKAAVGFAQAVDEYEKGRPGYSDDALLYLEKALTWPPDGMNRKLLDLAAGTGKFTKYLRDIVERQNRAGHVVSLLAVEPIREMRECLAEKYPDVTALDGLAEKIPLEDGSVDVVTVAQAFHWFDSEKAVREIARILKPRGRLALVWNLRVEDDPTAPWVAELSRMLARHEGGVPRFKSLAWRVGFEQHADLLRSTEAREFDYEQIGDLETMQARIASISFIAALEPKEKQRFLDETAVLLRRAIRPDGMIRMPYRTRVYLFDR